MVKGFTLIEMLVVVTIFAAVLGVVTWVVGVTLNASARAEETRLLNDFELSLTRELSTITNALQVQSTGKTLFVLIPKKQDKTVLFPLSAEKQDGLLVWDVYWLGDRFERFMRSQSVLEQNHPMIKERVDLNQYGSNHFETTLYHAKILGGLSPPDFNPDTVFDPNNLNPPKFAIINGQPSFETDLVPLNLFPNGPRPSDPDVRDAQENAGLFWKVNDGSFGFNVKQQSVTLTMDISAYSSLKEHRGKHRVIVTIRLINEVNK